MNGELSPRPFGAGHDASVPVCSRPATERRPGPAASQHALHEAADWEHIPGGDRAAAFHRGALLLLLAAQNHVENHENRTEDERFSPGAGARSGRDPTRATR